MSSDSVSPDWLISLSKIFEPLENLNSPDSLESFLSEFGWISIGDVTPITNILDISADLTEITTAITDENWSYLFDVIKKIILHLTTINTTFLATSIFSDWDISEEIPNYLIYIYLEKYQPKIFGILTILGLLSESNIPKNGIRDSYLQKAVHWDRIPKIFKDLPELMKEVYGWNENDLTKVTLTNSPLFDNLSKLLNGLGLSSYVAQPSEQLLDNYYDKLSKYREVPEFHANIVNYFDARDSKSVIVDVVMMPITPEGGKDEAPNGYMLGPLVKGAAKAEFDIGSDFKLSLLGGFESEAPVRMEIRPNGVKLKMTNNTTLDAKAKLSTSNKLPIILFGKNDSSHLEVLNFEVTLFAKGSEADLEFGIEIAIKGGKVVIVMGDDDGDGFIKKILPDKPIEIGFDMILGFSNKKGFYISGGVNLEYTISVHESLGPVRIDFITIRLSPKDGKLELFVTLTAGAKIGPLALIVEDVGLKANLDFAKFGLDLKFKLPKGVGVSIDASSVKGGGYLFIDEDKGQYAGVLQLQIQNIGLTAIGILNTKLPDNKKGYSLLIIITADFPAIQLGFGFALLGLGGILGLNRTMKVDILRDGIKNHTLDSVLFPQNPIENATKIISDLQMIFPPEEGRFVIGLMAKISWGTPPIITGEIGLALEIPDPIRIAIMGKIKAILPSQKEAILQLRLDVIGIIDFGKKELSIDASLYDSKIAQFDLSGDIALRTSWGDQPVFALACGGFHPRYQPPSSFPKLARLQLSLGSGGNPRLSLQAYMALTSNTVQFGARLDLYAEAFGFSVQGVLGFDTLIQFDPFAFMVDLYGGIAFKMGNTVLGAVTLDAQLSGPNPYHAYGKASIEILGIPASVTFDETWGQQIQQISPTTDLWFLLQKEFEKDGNWSAILPVNSSRAAIYSAKSIGFLDPFGSLVVEQRVLPLNHTLTKFGNSKPTSENYFDIKQVVIGGKSFGNLPEKRDFFAASQFSDLSDDEKLSRPDFDQMKSGIIISYDEITPTSDRIIETEIVLDTFIIDDKAKKILTEISRRFLDSSNLSLMATIGGRDMYQSNRLVNMTDETYVVASTNDMTIRTDVMNTKNMTKTAAISMMNSYLARHPEEKGNLQVMPIHEALTV